MQKMHLTSILLIVFALLGCAFNPIDQAFISGYNLNKPERSIILPDTLREISGLTMVDANTFACVQDENGIVFLYDMNQENLVRQFRFGVDGDYEGIARVDKAIYILRSDGTLFGISNFNSPDFKLSTYPTGIPAQNNEGLCYDANNHRLLIACKGKISKGPAYKDKRMIYAFDLKTKKMSPDPLFVFDLQTIKQFAIKYVDNLPSKTKKKGNLKEPMIKFMTSSIAIHPINKKLYLLSAADHLFFVFNMNGELEYLERLNPQTFNKAEGIAFLDNGDMLITNEGQRNKPTLLRFKYEAK